MSFSHIVVNVGFGGGRLSFGIVFRSQNAQLRDVT